MWAWHGCSHQSFISLPYRSSSQRTASPEMCEDRDDTRLEALAGTEIKNWQTQLKCASYLHPFFFMMFPSTTSALQSRRRETASLDKSFYDQSIYT